MEVGHLAIFSRDVSKIRGASAIIMAYELITKKRPTKSLTDFRLAHQHLRRLQVMEESAKKKETATEESIVKITQQLETLDGLAKREEVVVKVLERRQTALRRFVEDKLPVDGVKGFETRSDKRLVKLHRMTSQSGFMGRVLRFAHNMFSSKSLQAKVRDSISRAEKEIDNLGKQVVARPAAIQKRIETTRDSLATAEKDLREVQGNLAKIREGQRITNEKLWTIAANFHEEVAPQLDFLEKRFSGGHRPIPEWVRKMVEGRVDDAPKVAMRA